jgi:hypothetical protein
MESGIEIWNSREVEKIRNIAVEPLAHLPDPKTYIKNLKILKMTKTIRQVADNISYQAALGCSLYY